ncbi:2-oxoacid:ferredoxin oxidoreductase subunit beta [Cyclobacterium marinum]|jgi:2-oxoglutarate ferredoxin oxidoreductase subunit beta|uniref:Thiamine pyrophosphate TPP-binding domain-containing protein n=1 Tax=Cyclobacterium marinum (strain ATCC 25205 / DSM 745 / LMG 13164 / NCIMB 1802) TaxID=880070 RepID=G0J0H8_CYCMS|nr:2-oxoacid:ferredoxin oxidoreductase subunit beta [Cyclobacterium marinum]AEL23894.1 thiamine pyrophosphate TPP-binding domain-containing protein [Cyclobacterium marinum DSM 745]MBI0398689.1 2-oxoacid:ferredoxin oxidoreductase subunit beta [Cyclobacterium marinum]MBR9777676.1 2-oxoacid:ferredoxin oxidoreductase subunit beta [Cytophagales bacterium]|tara:strand:+ start:4675 stop:5727 length:1053 start_codon:yes stop_codon:yes gene_type:complete
MTYLKPLFRHPKLPKNKLGYTLKEYEGSISTLCAGCGHDSISATIVQACYELDIEPHLVAKISGIGCSSKTPAYFLGNSHGFNSVHGRMPSVATGANMANKNLVYFGVSGDGDTASIGMGQFVHAIRRNLNMVYIVMNNGCYGLTKGQDSATADLGSKSKAGSINPFQPVDLASLAVELGATFVAQSFSGDKQQLVPLIKAGIQHKGLAFINVMSPCVTFNNNPGSTKSYDYVREHMQATGTLDFVPEEKPIHAEYEEGTGTAVSLHDGSEMKLHKLAPDWDPEDRVSAANAIQQARLKDEILTGLLYINTEYGDLHDIINTSDTPLNTMKENTLCPGTEKLDTINAGFR